VLFHYFDRFLAKIEGVRVRTGGKVGWRIRLAAKSYDAQSSLFSTNSTVVDRIINHLKLT